jgi:methionyl aminopeptidase
MHAISFTLCGSAVTVVVKNSKDLENLMRIGQICGLTLQHMLAHVEPGMTTRQLDAIGAAFLKKHSAQSAPITAYKFPGTTCISLNDEVAHGVPGDRVIRAGDVVNVDVSAVLEGYWGDTGATMLVPPIKANMPLYSIGKAVEDVAKRGRYTIIRTLGGHGVGRGIHEDPTVFNYYTRQAKQPLTEGLVITIEPFLSVGKGRVYTARDGWTLKTVDRKVAAQYEHTVVIAGDKAIPVTKVS